jgi:hypothetical protein
MIELHPTPEALEDPYPATLKALGDVLKFARNNSGAMSETEYRILEGVGSAIASAVEARDPDSKHLVAS